MFPKLLIPYKRLKLFGANVIASENDEWNHHRNRAAHAFGERNDTLVFEAKRVVSISSTCGRPKGNGVRGTVAGDNMADVTFGGHYNCQLRHREHVAA